MRYWLLVLLIVLPLLIYFLTNESCYAQPIDKSKAVIHHTASHDVSAAEIDRWHKARGWDGIGYHFLIRENGDIEYGRPLNKEGAHSVGRNHYVGIALCGYDTFTDAQKESLEWLLKDLGVQEIEPHHEKCPGPGLKGIYKKEGGEKND